MCDTNRISIIVPVYNVEKYLGRCIESIINQTHKELEILLVDDGSTDQSGQICDAYAERDSRIRVFHKENGGVSSARNIGLEQAKGDYLGFVDADDYLHPEMYQLLLDNLQSTDADIATCRYCFDDHGVIKPVVNQKPILESVANIEEFLPYIYERDAYKGVSNYLWTKIYKKQLIKNEENHLLICFDETLVLGEDNVFNAEVYCKAKKIVYVDHPLYFYVQHDHSVMHNGHIQLHTLSILKGYERVIQIYEEKGIKEETIDLVKRFYTYWCGKYLEQSIEENNTVIGLELQKKIKSNFLSYVKMNMDHLERVKWLIDLLEYQFKTGVD